MAIVVGTIIGSGIFLVPREMMQDVGSSALVYLAWIVGGLLSLFGAMTYAELGAMMPYAGGEYVFLRGVYGDTPAFLYMWTWFAVAKPAHLKQRVLDRCGERRAQVDSDKLGARMATTFGSHRG